MRTWYKQMDGLRFIAISSVMVEHFAYGIARHINAGNYGVELFFVISGFLITEGLLLNKESEQPRWKTIRHFFIKRFLRIFPIYYLVLFIALFTYPPFMDIAAYAFTYTINYYAPVTGIPLPPAFSHFWSLNVEEQFYVFWPFLIIFIAGRRGVLLSVLLIMTASLYHYFTHEYLLDLPSRMYELCLGAILAYTKIYHPDFYARRVMQKFWIIFALFILITLYDSAVGIAVFSMGLVYMGSNNAFKGIFRRILEHRIPIYVGKTSYGIYLYHKPIALIVGFYLFDPFWINLDFSFFPALRYNSWIVKLPLYYLLAIGVSHVSFQFIERPLLQYKKRLK